MVEERDGQTFWTAVKERANKLLHRQVAATLPWTIGVRFFGDDGIRHTIDGQGDLKDNARFSLGRTGFFDGQMRWMVVGIDTRGPFSEAEYRAELERVGLVDVDPETCAARAMVDMLTAEWHAWQERKSESAQPHTTEPTVPDDQDHGEVPEFHELPRGEYGDDYLGMLQRLVDEIDAGAMQSRRMYRLLIASQQSPQLLPGVLDQLRAGVEMDEKLATMLRDFSRLSGVVKALRKGNTDGKPE